MKINKVVSDVKKFSPLTIFLLCILVIVLVFWKFQPTLWPGGYGIGKGESVLTKTIEKDKQGKIVKTIETIKYDDGKTLWDWGSLFIVPLSLAILGFFLQQQQQKRAEQFSREQQERADKLSEEQRKIADNETKEEVLQTYFDRLSVLLIDKNLIALANKAENISLEEKELLDSSLDIIRARTLSILRRFENDVERKSIVIKFLIETEIIAKLKLDLSGANLSGADLSFANLRDANLREADLSFAIFHVAYLGGANLRLSNLREANLTAANLTATNLSSTDLSRTNLSDADFNGANLSSTDISYADFRGAKHLTVKQVTSALNWEKGKYDNDFREKLGLPPLTQEQL